ncbi:TPA: hypothetical protein QCX74_004054 [Bacillus mycoides]|nr:hypothetical protein [Bacillus mycoides]
MFRRNWADIDNDVRIEYKEGSNKKWWDYDLYVRTTKFLLKPHVVFNSASGKAGVYKFLLTLRTEGGNREIFIELQEKGIGSINKKIIVDNTNTVYELEYRKQKDDSDLFTLIYWNDDRKEPIILNSLWTFMIFP